MNAYTMGQLAGMQKSALNIKGWTRLLAAARRRAPKMFRQTALPRDLMSGTGQLIPPKMQEAMPLMRQQAKFRGSSIVGTGIGEMALHPVGTNLRRLSSLVDKGGKKALAGGEGLMLRKELERSMGMVDPVGAAKSMAPRAVPYSEIAKKSPSSAVWRGTSVPKDMALSRGERIWASGEPDVGALYSLHGGEVNNPGNFGRVLTKRMRTGSTYKKNPLYEALRRNPDNPETHKYLKSVGLTSPEGFSAHQKSPVYETTYRAPKKPLGDVAKAWRVFPPKIPDSAIEHARSDVSSLLDKTMFVPVSRSSLRKWMQAIAPSGTVRPPATAG